MKKFMMMMSAMIVFVCLSGCRSKPVSKTHDIQELKGHSGVIGALTFSPDGKTLASTGKQIGRRTGRSVILWDFPSGRMIRRFAKHRGSVLTVAFSQDGRLLASGGANKTVLIQERATGKQLASLPHPGRVMKVAFSPNNKTLAVAGYNNHLQLWTVQDKRLLWSVKARAALFSMHFSRNGKHIYTGGNSRFVTKWSVKKGKLLKRFAEPHFAEIEDLSITANKKRILDINPKTLESRMKKLGIERK